MAEFKYPDDLILNLDSSPKMKYDDSKTFYQNIHYGQVKLFTNELEFLLSFVFQNDERVSSSKKIVLYVGAGPGEHLSTLAKMFPTVEWHLFDNKFDPSLKKVDNVFLEFKYFDDYAMKTYAEVAANPDNDLYMISDIRNLTYDSKNFGLEDALKSLEDMNLQRKWVEFIKPKYTMLKFKLPINEKEIVDALGTSLEYLPGVIYKQPWARGKSIETRLIISRNSLVNNDSDNVESTIYSIEDFEQMMFYHNAVTRQKEYQFPFADDLNGYVISKHLKLNKRYDSAYIITVLAHYFTRMNPKMGDSSMKNNIIKVLKMIGHRDYTVKYITS